MSRDIRQIREILGEQSNLLDHTCKTIARDALHLPGPRYIEDVFTHSDRSPRVPEAHQTARVRGAPAFHC